MQAQNSFPSPRGLVTVPVEAWYLLREASGMLQALHMGACPGMSLQAGLAGSKASLLNL